MLSEVPIIPVINTDFIQKSLPDFYSLFFFKVVHSNSVQDQVFIYLFILGIVWSHFVIVQPWLVNVEPIANVMR